MARVITITSGKGGTGKTTTAINLGVALSSLGEDVTVVDANLTTPNVGLHLGAPIVPISLNHILLGKAAIEDAIYEHESGTKIMPSSLSVRELDKVKFAKLGDVAKRLRKGKGYVIFDSAAGLGEEAVAAMSAADDVIIVTNPEMPSVTDALKTVKVAEGLDKTVSGVILTRYTGDKNEMSLASIKDLLEVPILGIVPEDKRAKEALSMKNALVYTHPRSKAARAYKKIAAKLCGKRVKEDKWYQKLFGLGSFFSF
jgi:septum site-determining protein MinD